MIDPDRDLYAIPSQDGNDIYFLSLVDILTHYGNNNILTIHLSQLSPLSPKLRFSPSNVHLYNSQEFKF